MFTQTSKLFLPVAGVALVLSAVYKIMTGDVLGGALYLILGSVAFLLGIMLSTVRENEYAPVVAADAPPPAVRPVSVRPLPGGGGWPVVVGLSAALVMLGLIEHALFTWAGVLLAFVAGAGWLARAASETTGRSISLLPIGLPVLGLATIGSVMFFLSRILLAVSETASWVLALLVGVVILGIASIAAVRPNISGRSLAAALAIGSLVMVGGGLVAASVGERDIEAHSEEHAGDAGRVQLAAENIAFEHDTITLAANTDIELEFDNNDRETQHNITILGQDPTKPIFRGQLVTGVATVTYTFHAPGPGEYKFQCDIHPAQMKGTVKVV
ncbi:MAG TPA: cupredoxin domain-containing protein [Acidimicrobiales bacterium]|nr:cupredoxin domain-containing protein [Acidimicrobiales bacterium]